MKILFIGSFLSKRTGTKSISEKIKDLLSDEFEIQLSSFCKNQILRLAAIVFSSIFSKANLVHIDVFSGTAFYISRTSSYIAKIRKRKIILNLRGGKLPEFYNNRTKEVSDVLRRADIVVTPSKYLQHFFKDKGIDVQHLSNFIELDKFCYQDNAINNHSILWVRAFTDIYNPHLAVEILNKVRETYPDVHLTMVGPDKGNLEYITSLIDKYQLVDNISITGPVDNDLLQRYYHTHQVYLNTTSYESFGTAVIEAMSCGLPVVSSKVGELPYLWTDKKDILFADTMSPNDFSDNILQLFSDQELSRNIAINANKEVLKYNWSNIKPLWINLLKG